MSEMMNSVEIEDVLSSIRRLVSEDLRTGPRSIAAIAPMTLAPALPDPIASGPIADSKLILTPAFRVVAQPESAPLILPRLHLGAEPATRVVSTLQRAVEAQSTEWESEVGDPPLLINDMEWSENGWVAPATQTAQVVQFVTPVQDATPSWAQVEPEIIEPDASNPEPIAEPDRNWADQAEAEVVAQLYSEAQPMAEAGFADLPLDEQVLRELIRELIVQELQGTLGERITRNVRKLVRAEIARAISVHGVE